MRRGKEGGRFPVEYIGRAIMNCRPVQVGMEKVKDWLARADIGLARGICMTVVAVFIVFLLLMGHGTRMPLHFRAIHPVTTIGAEPRQPPAKAFAVVWDSLMADPVTKNRWDSLLRLRPGLRDTVRQLQKMDSAVWGR